MKSKGDIEMDFSRAISQAQELENISKELSDIATLRMEEAFRMLSRSWSGDNYDLFVYKCGKLSEGILKTADDLNRVSKNIKSTANIVYTAEKAALQIGF